MFSSLSIRTLRKVHLYLSCAVAPLLLFFIISGSWQTFMLHRGTKDNTYRPPAIVAQLSAVHTTQSLPRAEGASTEKTPFRIIVLLMSVGLVLTISIGVIMAFRVSQRKRLVWMTLTAGAAVPALVVLLELALR
ncbi:MAG: hypothetical protein IIA66_01945 [Planctomycetes bacterium]|nr:hypothetical protein [Planctomycetota bacterium]